MLAIKIRFASSKYKLLHYLVDRLEDISCEVCFCLRNTNRTPEEMARKFDLISMADDYYDIANDCRNFLRELEECEM